MDDHGFIRGTLRTRPLGDEWVLAVRTQANLLVTGRRAVIDRAIREVSPWLRHPIVRVTCNLDLTLPMDASTLILHGVEALTDAEQTTLLKYLDGAHSAMQVISSTAAPLYPRYRPECFQTSSTIVSIWSIFRSPPFSHGEHPITPNPSSWAN